MSLSAPPSTDGADSSKETNTIPSGSLEQIISAIINTAAHPDLLTIFNDVSLVLNLINKFKQTNGALHPTAIQVLKALL